MHRHALLVLVLVAFSAGSPPAGAAGSLSADSEAHLTALTKPAASAGARDRLSALQRHGAFRNVAHGLDAGSVADFKDTEVRRDAVSQRHHRLTNKQLQHIYSIKCLKDKQQNPNVHCEYNGELQEWHKEYMKMLSIGTFPKNFEDRQCNSRGQFFCDANQVLKGPQVIKLTDKLRDFKDQTTVKCASNADVTDPYAAEHSFRNFNLAVVIADEWPSQETDAASLQKFGLVVMGQWGLMPMYNGVDTANSVDDHYTWNEYYKNCPNAAVLIVLPAYNEVFLSSPSCEFICSSRGGPEVKAAMERVLEREGVAAAIQVGIDKVGQALRETSPLSLVRSFHEKEQKAEREKVEKERLDFAVTLGQRLLLFLMGGLTIAIIPSAVYWASLEIPKDIERV